MALTLEQKKEIEELIREYMNKTVEIPVEICRDDVQLPCYACEGDAGMDVRAAEDIRIEPQQTVVVPTGLMTAIPDGYEIQVRPRSGLSLKTPLRVANAPGTIDSGYRNEIGVIIYNSSLSGNSEEYGIDEKGNKPGTYIIKKGDRIAQLVLARFETIDFVRVSTGKVKTMGRNRGGGFGHTGTKN